MSFLYRIFRYAWFTAWYSFALLAVVAALTLSAARLVLPVIADRYNSEVESLVSDLLKQPVSIGTMDAEWRGLGPRLVLHDVLFLEPGGGGAVLSLDRASIGFDLLVLVRTGQLGLSSVSLSGFNLILRRLQDGRITVAGIDAAEPDHQQQHELDMRAWLLAQNKLEVEHASVFWIDHLKQGRVWQFNDLRFLLRNQGQRHQVQGFANLPEAMGKDLEFHIDLEGDPISTTDWQGQAYVRGVGLDLATVADELGAQFPLRSGRTNFKVWSSWRGGRPYRLTGEFSGVDTAIVYAKQAPLRLTRVGARFALQQVQDEWHLDLSRFHLQRDQRYWPDSTLHARWRQQDDRVTVTRLAVSYLDIGQVLEVADYFSLVPAEYRELLATSRPNGILRNVIATFPADRAGYLQTEFSGVSSRAWGAWPEFAGVSGIVTTDFQHFKLQVSGSAMSLAYPQQFPAGMHWDELDGVLYGVFDPDYFYVASSDLLLRNSDVHGRAQFTLFWPRTRVQPYLDLQADIEHLDGAKALEYLPVSVTGEGFRRWWQRAVVHADVDTGHVTMSGWLDAFPYGAFQGKLAVDGVLHNGELQYVDEWPEVAHISGAIQMRNNRFVMQNATGSMFDSALSNVVVEIEDLTQSQPMAGITGMVTGATQDKIDFLLKAPPLRKMFKGLDAFSLAGDSSLDLKLLVPTTGHQEVQVQGEVAMRDNRLVHRGALGPVLTEVTGVLKFTGDSIEVDGMAARLFEQAVTIDALTRNTRNGAQAVFTAAGRYDAAGLAQRLRLEDWAHLYQGSEDFSASLVLPLDGGGAPRLELTAQLDQISTYLPAPLRKDAGEAMDLKARLVFHEDRQDWIIQYGAVVSAALVMVPTSTGYTLSHGEIVVGKGRASLVWPRGLAIKGKLDSLVLDDWFKIFATAPEPAAVSRKLPVLPQWVANANIKIEKLTVFSRDFDQAELSLGRDPVGAVLSVASKQLTGKVTLPDDATLPLDVDLDYWNMVSVAASGDKPPDPNAIPAMNIRAKELAYNGASLGTLSLVVTATAQGIQVVDLSVLSETTMIKGAVDWVYRSGRHITSLDLVISSKNVGVSMSQLGYANTIDNGTGTLRVKAEWSGAPMDPLKHDLTGEINLKFKDGRLLELNPGAGKVLAILSLQMLPKRLLLDFSDMFKKGFSFTQISGDFSIQDADAYTTNLVMEGPSAKIHIAGRTGLADRDYDQLVTVIPDVTASIPVLAWWLVDPATGLLAFALQKIFQNQIDDVVKFQYIITGTWEHPVVTKVAAVTADPAAAQP